MEAVGTDVLGAEPRRVPATGPRERAVGVLAALVLVAGVLAAGRPAPVEPPSDDPAVAVEVLRGSASRTGPGVRGEVVVAVRSLAERRVLLGALSLRAPGLRVTSVLPPLGDRLEAGEARELVVAYEVSSCAELVLPVALRLAYLPGGAAPARSAGVDLADVPGQPCPPGSTRQARPSLAVSGLGASVVPAGEGVEGVLRLEVRNGGERLQLLQVGAEAPGVLFSVVGPPNGVTLVTEERTEVRLGYRVPDCAALGRTGRVVLRTRYRGRVREVVLVVDERAGASRQSALDPVLMSCG